MSMAEELGRPMIQRSWFERQFVRNPAGELHFREGPFRPLRAADAAERDEYVARATAHMAKMLGWIELTAIPMALFLAVSFTSGLGVIAMAIDLAILWAVLRFAPDLRETRRRVRAVVDRWPVVTSGSPRRYFAQLWSGESFAHIGRRERRTVLASGLFFSVAGAFLVALGHPLGWLRGVRPAGPACRGAGLSGGAARPTLTALATASRRHQSKTLI